MFIGKFELDNRVFNNIYYKCSEGYELWHKDTFSPTCENIEVLDFKISGKDYRERQSNLVEIAKEWQLHFSQFNWYYSELYEIEDWFYKNAKRYGLVKEFRENGIC